MKTHHIILIFIALACCFGNILYQKHRSAQFPDQSYLGTIPDWTKWDSASPPLTPSIAFYKPSPVKVKLTPASNLTESPDAPQVLKNQSITLRIPYSAVDREVEITITAVSDAEIAPLPPDLINVTKGSGAYELLPHRLQFQKEVEMELGYDPTKIPEGYTAGDIRTFFYDDLRQLWTPIRKIALCKEDNLLISGTSHFSDYINGIIQVPETSPTQTLDKNTMKGIEYAAASQEVVLLDFPSANTQGTANFGLPLKVTKGRFGLYEQPSINYNNEAGNGKMGLGWDLNLPAIAIETRWGVPRYDPLLETETYLFEGEHLFPVAHRSKWKNREPNKVFYRRVEGSFDKIIRWGDHPAKYWWEVIKKDGTHYFYGGLPDKGVINSAVLRTEDNTTSNIAHWCLVEKRDLNENFVRYHYRLGKHVGNTGGILGKQIYVDRISYTGHGQDEGKYEIRFKTDLQLQEPIRPDVMINCRLGFKQVTAERLRRIEMNFESQPIRSYQFEYIRGAFNKSLLAHIIEFDRTETEFTRHSFDYFDEVSKDQSPEQYNFFLTKEGAEIPRTQIGPSFQSPIGGIKGNVSSLSSSKNGGSTAGVSVAFGANNWRLFDKSLTVEGNIAVSTSGGNGSVSLVDVDGDRLLDQLFKLGNTVYYHANTTTPGSNQVTFGQRKLLNGITGFSRSSTRTTTLGAAGNVTGGSIGYNNSKSKTKTTIYMSDFNNDGFMDIIQNGIVRFGYLDENLELRYTVLTENTASQLISGAPLDSNIVEVDPNAQAILEKEFPLHDVVRVWEAPFNGVIKITAPISMLINNSIEAREYIQKDGIRADIQFKNQVKWSQILTEGINANPDLPTFEVKAGDKIYFRVHSIFNGGYDLVDWDPSIRYTDIAGDMSITRDPNGKQLFRYQASTDFLAASPQSVSMPFDGKIHLQGRLIKPIMTDSVIVSIFKRNDNEFEYLLNDTLPPEDNISEETYHLDSLEVKLGDELYFKITSTSNVDWQALQWQPSFHYYKAGDINPFDSDGNPLYYYEATVNHSIYSKCITLGNNRFLASETMEYAVGASLQFNAEPFREEGTMTLTIKGNNRLYAKRTVNINRRFQVTSLVRAQVEENDEIFVECFFSSEALAKEAKEKLNFQGAQPSFYAIRENFEFGPQYRNWGQFVYNANEGRDSLPILQEELEIDPEIRNPNVDMDAIRDTTDMEGQFDPTTSTLVLMYLDPTIPAWRGFDDSTYVRASQMCASRLGEDDISVNLGLNSSIFTVPYQLNESTSHGASLGPNILSGSLSWLKSKIILDSKDLNGDGYPDALSSTKIQFTLPTGGFEGFCIRHNLGIHSSYGHSKGLAIGGSFSPATVANSAMKAAKAVIRPKSAGNESANKTENAKQAGFLAQASISVSGNLTIEKYDHVNHTWLDINGDGLPDKIYKDGVALNLGYDFLPKAPWGHTAIRKGESDDVSAGLGISLFGGSISGGINYSQTDNYSLYGIQDINGDGLPDILTANDLNQIFVQLNTGSGFLQAKLFHQGHKLDEGSSSGEAKRFAFTVCIPIVPFPAPVAKLCINPSVAISQGVSRQHSQIADIDGDGFPEFLYSADDGHLEIERSKIGKTNLLKSVRRPMGSSFSLDYERTGNTKILPMSKWVLADLMIKDGLDGDGASTMRTSFSYQSPKYDRHERSFYGFGKVTTIQYNTEDDDARYRSIVATYDNSSYYHKGLLVNELTLGKDRNPFKEISNKYQLLSVLDGSVLSAQVESSPDTMAFPALKSSIELSFEGDRSTALERRRDYEYDNIGNVIFFHDTGDGTDDDWVESTITYHSHALARSEPASITVQAADGIIRRRESEIDPVTANVIQIRRFLIDGNFATHDLTYDQFGNLKSITNPPNQNGERMHYEYYYDDEVHTYRIRVMDGYQYESTAKHEYLFGQLIESTDINGQKISYSIDNVGRVKTVTSPYEVMGPWPTITFDYHPEAVVPYATTSHFDPEHQGEILTVTFMDGLQRPIQTKKTGVVLDEPNGFGTQEVMIVSGKVIFDAFGREKAKSYPTIERRGQALIYNDLADAVPPTRIDYDILDRQTRITLPDGVFTTMSYDLVKDNSDTPCLRIRTVDGQGFQKDQYLDIRGRKRATTDFGPNGEIWTSFRYNPADELIAAIDHQGNATTNTYDNLGRRLSFDHPDGGLVSNNYDLASNLIEVVTPEIRDKIPQGGAIIHTYEKERLIRIDYPKNFQNQVRLHYGKPGDPHNRAGRVWLREDATGGKELFYGPFGEVVKEIRTIYLNPLSQMTYVTSFKYDVWDRLQELTYPDGEKVEFDYNDAGKVERVKGFKNGKPYLYVDHIAYDKFEDRVLLRYGNGTTTRYSFEDQRRRLKGILAENSQGHRFMDNHYVYDEVNNVKSIENRATAQYLRLGGTSAYSFGYDSLHRLISAQGTWDGNVYSSNYKVTMAYDNLHNITRKEQFQSKGGLEVVKSSYEHSYSYAGDSPHAPDQIGDRSFYFDLNGNTLACTDSLGLVTRQLFWDEKNQLMGVLEGGYWSQYTYDADGNRTIKSEGGIQGNFINGAPVGPIRHDGKITIYINPYLEVSEKGFTKHFFLEGGRIVSKLGHGKFENNIPSGTTGLTAGNRDYIRRMSILEDSVMAFYNSLDINIGSSEDPYRPFQPEVSGIPFPPLTAEDEDYIRPPLYWPNNLGNPFCNSSGITTGITTTHNVEPGYGYVESISILEANQFFYHSDHLGSSNYLTDYEGRVRQHMEYTPFGELFVEEHNSDDRQSYLFSGKQLDEATGYYYFGARYLDPKYSLWLSVDPLAEKYPGWSPYNYTLHNPMKFVDPDGRLPQMLIGAGIGAGMEYGMQVTANLVSGKSLGQALANVDIKQIIISGAMGAAGVGLHKKFGNIMNKGYDLLASNYLSSAGGSILEDIIDGKSINLREAHSDGVVGMLFTGVSESKTLKKFFSAFTGKKVDKFLKRLYHSSSLLGKGKSGGARAFSQNIRDKVLNPMRKSSEFGVDALIELDKQTLDKYTGENN